MHVDPVMYTCPMHPQIRLNQANALRLRYSRL
jgi:hypothetical protein